MARNGKTGNEDWKKLPTVLIDYLKRIGVEIPDGIISFRRAVIKEKVTGSTYGSYERASISFKDGIVKTSGGYKPTKEEQEAITEAFKKVKLPTSIHATKQDALGYVEKMRKNPDDFFFMWD